MQFESLRVLGRSLQLEVHVALRRPPMLFQETEA